MKRIIMNMKANPKLNNFIQDIRFMDEDKGETVISLRKLVLEITPSAKEDIKYGGLVFVSDKRLFCGIFIRKSIYLLSLTEARRCKTLIIFLKEAEKNRRHLKIFQQEDIKNKKVEYYIKQSFKL